MQAAVTARNSDYDGQFYYGVLTTGVFCRPSCPSRAARPENLRFFPSIEAAMSAGYRPCKHCHPGGNPELKRLIEIAGHIEMHFDEKLTLGRLADKAGLSASRLQRVFKAAFGISPGAYQDAVRMRRFKAGLKAGEEVTDAIYAAGYGSLSRVYGEKTRNIGMTPSAYRRGGQGEVIHWACRETALGPVMMAATDVGVCFVQFGENQENLLKQLTREFPCATLLPSRSSQSAELDLWVRSLDAHISHNQPRPDLPLDMRGTAFQAQVWRFLLSIPEGEVISYTELAQGIGKPRAARAAATACAANRIAVLVPCHRVLRGDGGLGGYRWGMERKRALLDTERARTRGKR